MGTRGAYGFRIEEKDKVTYNHFDSYPTGLGRDIMLFIRDTTIGEMKDIANAIILVDDNDKPTEEQMRNLQRYADIKVSTGKLDEWYVLLHNTQGNLSVYKEGLKYMIDNHEFMADSLFCEWAYIVNIDTEMLEVYIGFNKNPNGKGRYAKFHRERDSEYYGVALIGEIAINSIRILNESTIEKLCEEIEKIESSDDQFPQFCHHVGVNGK